MEIKINLERYIQVYKYPFQYSIFLDLSVNLLINII